MSSENTEDEPLFDDPNAALREIARNPAAYARYLADFHRVVLEMAAALEVLQRETRVHCRGTHVEGDRMGQAFMRSFPVEKSLNNVLKNLKSMSAGLEKSARKRYAHDEKVQDLKEQRKENAQLNKQKSSQPLQAAPENNGQQGAAPGPNMGYGGPTTVYDLKGRESA